MKTKGFTVIELLIVVSIIGILATIISQSPAWDRVKNPGEFYKNQFDERVEKCHSVGLEPIVEFITHHNDNVLRVVGCGRVENRE